MDERDKLILMNAARLYFRQSNLMKEAKERAKHPTIKGVRGGKMYICAKCNKTFSGRDVQIDHIEPVIPIGTPKKEMSLMQFYDRLYCDISNLQVLCKPCHVSKSVDENNGRN